MASSKTPYPSDEIGPEYVVPTSITSEIDAMSSVAATLDGLDEQARQRVFFWAGQRFNIVPPPQIIPGLSGLPGGVLPPFTPGSSLSTPEVQDLIGRIASRHE